MTTVQERPAFPAPGSDLVRDPQCSDGSFDDRLTDHRRGEMVSARQSDGMIEASEATSVLPATGDGSADAATIADGTKRRVLVQVARPRLIEPVRRTTNDPTVSAVTIAAQQSAAFSPAERLMAEVPQRGRVRIAVVLARNLIILLSQPQPLLRFNNW
jgi:hypothetical protein